MGLNNLVRGWEIGEPRELVDEDDDLMNLDPDRTCERFNGSDLEDADDEEWRC